MSFFSTPTFELFRRGLEPRIIKRFRGINAYKPLTQLGPEWAQDLLNVIIGSNGQPSKFRLPVALSPVTAFPTGPLAIFDFQQANGTRQIVTDIGGVLYYFTGDGTVGPTRLPDPLNLAFVNSNVSARSPFSMVEVSNVLFAANGNEMFKWTGTDALPIGIFSSGPAPGVVAVAGNLSPVFGYEWAYSWKSSGAVHTGVVGVTPINVGNASLATVQTGAGLVNKSFTVTTSAGVGLVPGLFSNTNPDVDTIILWRTTDGGGDLFRVAEINVYTGAVSFNAATVTSAVGALGFFTVITDNTPDVNLDQTTRAPFLNTNPASFGKYLAVGQGRLVIMNLGGAPQDAIYSGYERILIGNPPECFPPNNRLRLSIGAESIAGGGVIQAGVVMFSNTDRMYMLRGQMEDITDTAPVQFTQYLEELPWKIGCFSHATIQATPYGLVWLAGDKTVQLFDGHSQPQDISQPVYPILRNITPGSENACSAAYFNWLERDWYVLLVPYNGSLTPNRQIWWGLDKDTGTIDIFVSTIPADGIGVVTTSKLQRQLLIGRVGQLFNLPVSSDTTGGIADLSIIPATNGQLAAYWRSGYFGNDSPQRAEMFRWLRLITDQDPGAFQALIRGVDDETNTIANPYLIGPRKLSSSKLGINRRFKRLSVEIDFPSQDVSANVLELQVNSIPSSDR